MLHTRDAPQPRVDEPAAPVAPAAAGDGGGERERDGGEEREVPAVLPLHDARAAQVADVRRAGLHARAHEHPADVRVQQPARRVVRVQRRVRVPVVRAVPARPPERGALHRARAHERERVLERHAGIVRAVRPEAVVPCCGTWGRRG